LNTVITEKIEAMDQEKVMGGENKAPGVYVWLDQV